MSDEITTEQLEIRLANRLIEQTALANTVLWGALVHLLLRKTHSDGSPLVDADEVVAFVSHESLCISKEQNGAYCKAIIAGAMKAVASLKHGAPVGEHPESKFPEWIKRAISGEEPIHTINFASDPAKT